MKALLFTILLSIAGFSYADCQFDIVNATQHKFTVEVGFYGESNESFVVAGNSSDSHTIKSNNYICNSISLYNTGVAYITLLNDERNGGWRYDVDSDTIKASGEYTGDNSGRRAKADDKADIWLSSGGDKVSKEKVFKASTMILNSSRINSRNASIFNN